MSNSPTPPRVNRTPGLLFCSLIAFTIVTPLAGCLADQGEDDVSTEVERTTRASLTCDEVIETAGNTYRLAESIRDTSSRELARNGELVESLDKIDVLAKAVIVETGCAREPTPLFAIISNDPDVCAKIDDLTGKLWGLHRKVQGGALGDPTSPKIRGILDLIVSVLSDLNDFKEEYCD